QECHPRGTCELLGGPNLVGGKGLSAQGVNQTKLIIVARHGRQLSAHGLQGEEESAIHDRDSNIGSGSAFLKEEVFTLQKRGSFHFALTGHCSWLDNPLCASYQGLERIQGFERFSGRRPILPAMSNSGLPTDYPRHLPVTSIESQFVVRTKLRVPQSARAPVARQRLLRRLGETLS